MKTALIAVVVATIASAALAQHAMPPSGIRLPPSVVPIAYEARLVVDPAQDTLSGTIAIRVRVDAPTDVVWLNARALDIREARITTAATNETAVDARIVAGGEQVIGLQAGPLAVGEATLHFAWQARFETVSLAGAIKQREAGQSYVFTQFEPLDARRVFPCFDEPGFKAPWTLTLVVRDGDRALSNMPIESEQAAGAGLREVRFARSPPLPTYLVAFAVGPYDIVDGGTAGRRATPLRYAVPKGRAADAAYAREATPRIVEALERYFDTPFPFPKLDSVVMPDSWLAMENAGMITYGARHILANDTDRTRAFEQHYTVVAAHEVSHQWFGDLVTPAWWDDLWLNEAFATWIADKIADELHPDWRWSERLARRRGWAIETDRLASARRVRNAVTALNDVRAAFDGITYIKGASVLTMFEDWLTPEQFRAGVRRYLAQHTGGNATADDFFGALAASDAAVLPAFKGFVDRTGVPLLDVSLDCTAAPKLALAQSRFVPAGAHGASAQSWVFPACFEFPREGSAYRQCALVRNATQSVSLDTSACPAWVVANRTSVGYFLPRLDAPLRARLHAAALDDDAAQTLLADTNMLVQGSALPLADAVRLAARYANDRNPRVVRAAVEIARNVPLELYAGHEERWATWVRSTFGPAARGVGWTPKPDENPDIVDLRDDLVPFVADIGRDRDLARDAVATARRALRDPDMLSRDARRTLFAAAARVAGGDAPRLYAEYVDAANRTGDDEHRRILISALGGFRAPALQSKAFALVLSDAFVPRETFSILRTALRDAPARPGAIAWLDHNVDAALARAPAESARGLVYWADGACRQRDRDAIERLFSARTARIEGGAQALGETLEQIDVCLAYRRLQKASLDALLRLGGTRTAQLAARD